MSEENKEIELQQYGIIVKIPENCISLTITAQVVIDGKIETVQRELKQSEIFDARRDFLDNVELGDDYDGVWALTDEYRNFVENGGTYEEWERDHV